MPDLSLWKQADAVLDDLLRHTDHPTVEDIDSLDLSPELRASVVALVEALGHSGPLDQTVSLQSAGSDDPLSDGGSDGGPVAAG